MDPSLAFKDSLPGRDERLGNAKHPNAREASDSTLEGISEVEQKSFLHLALVRASAGTSIKPPEHTAHHQALEDTKQASNPLRKRGIILGAFIPEQPVCSTAPPQLRLRVGRPADSARQVIVSWRLATADEKEERVWVNLRVRFERVLTAGEVSARMPREGDAR